jgi:hypothetical protein
MAIIVSYATLLTQVTAWLHRGSDAALAVEAEELVQFGENRIYRDLRVRQMETALSDTIASGVIAVPTGYIEMKHARIDGTPTQKMERKDAEWIYHNYPSRSAGSKPKFFAREGSNFIFGPYPDSNYTVKGNYYKKLTALSDDNPTNWLITDVPDLILFAALCEAEPYIQNDERIALWERKYDQIRARVQREDDNEEFSGSPLSATVR